MFLKGLRCFKSQFKIQEAQRSTDMWRFAVGMQMLHPCDMAPQARDHAIMHLDMFWVFCIYNTYIECTAGWYWDCLAISCLLYSLPGFHRLLSNWAFDPDVTCFRDPEAPMAPRSNMAEKTSDLGLNVILILSPGLFPWCSYSITLRKFMKMEKGSNKQHFVVVLVLVLVLVLATAAVIISFHAFTCSWRVFHICQRWRPGDIWRPVASTWLNPPPPNKNSCPPTWSPAILDDSWPSCNVAWGWSTFVSVLPCYDGGCPIVQPGYPGSTAAKARSNATAAIMFHYIELGFSAGFQFDAPWSWSGTR